MGLGIKIIQINFSTAYINDVHGYLKSNQELFYRGGEEFIQSPGDYHPKKNIYSMKKTAMVFLLALVCLTSKTFSQMATNPKDFHGAKTNLKSYKALYVLNESGEKKIKSVIRNINNSLDDPRLKGKLQVELVVFGDGVGIFKKSNHYDTLLLALQKRGVILAQCENTIEERKISKDELWPFISYVPSGNGEIIIRQYQGWVIVHP